MSTKIRALLWEELRTGGVIAGWCVMVGFLCLLFIGVPQYFEGSKRLYAGPTIAVSLGTILTVVLLLRYRTGNSGGLTGGFSGRFLLLPIETWRAVGIILALRGGLVLATAFLSISGCHLLLGYGPLWVFCLFMPALYFLVQGLGWIRRTMPLLAGFGLLLLLTALAMAFFGSTRETKIFWGFAAVEHIFYTFEDVSSTSTASFPVSTLSAMLLLLLSAALAYGASLVGVNLARCGERSQRGIRFRLPETLPMPGGPGVQGFSSPQQAFLWGFLRKEGFRLPMVTLALSFFAGLSFVVFDYFFIENAYGFSQLYGAVLEWAPWVALVLAALAWGATRGGAGLQRGARPSLTEFLYPTSSAEMTVARLLGQGIVLGVTWLAALIMSSGAFFLGNNALTWRIYKASWAAGESSLREILTGQLALPLLILLAAWVLMALRTRLVACFFGLLILLGSIAGASEGMDRDALMLWPAALLIGGIFLGRFFSRKKIPWHVALWAIPCSLAALLGTTSERFIGHIVALVVALMIVLPAAALAWAWRRGLIPRRHLLGCALAWTLTTLFVYPFGESEFDRFSLLLAVAAGALVVLPYPALFLDLHRRRHSDDTAVSAEDNRQSTSWKLSPTLRIAGSAILMVFLLIAVWMRWPAPPAYIEALRGQGQPATIADLAESYGPLPKEENAALHYLDVIRQQRVLEGEWKKWLAQQSSEATETDAKLLYSDDNPLFYGDIDFAPNAPVWTEMWEIARMRDTIIGRPISEALAKISEGTYLHSHYPVTLGAGVPSVTSTHLSTLRGLARTQALSVWIATIEDRPADVVEGLRVMGALAASLREEPILVSQLVRIAIYGLLVEAVEQSLSRTEFNADQLIELQDFLTTILPPVDEYSIHAQGMLGEQVFSANFSMGLENTDDAYSTTMRRLQNGAVSSYRTIALRFFAEMDENRTNTELPFVTKIQNASGTRYIMMNILAPGLSRAREAEWRCRVSLDMAATACAVERYRLAHGRLPVNLAALVPEYMVNVAEDPFRDSGPISYRVREDGGYVIYTWGYNRTDEQGIPPVKGRSWINGDGTFSVAAPAFRDGPQITDIPPVDEEEETKRR